MMIRQWFIYGVALCTAMVVSIPTHAIDAESLAPDIALPRLENNKAGAITQLSDYKGKLVYLDFWASWCGPCRQSFPFLQALREQYGKQGFEVVAINTDTQTDKALQFLKHYPVNYPILLDPRNTVAQAYNIQGLPTAFIIARDGTIIYKHLGFKEKDKQWIKALIEQNISPSTTTAP